MTLYLKYALSSLIGFSSGAVISGAVFAFIAIIGLVPRLAQKTGTTGQIVFYEEALMVGGIFGTLTMAFDFRIPAGPIIVAFLSLCAGIFVGSLAVCLAEVLDVIPIMTRRARLRRGLYYFMLALAVGKLAGSMIYFLMDGFYKPD